jgi:hypothetical protein
MCVRNCEIFGRFFAALPSNPAAPPRLYPSNIIEFRKIATWNDGKKAC